VATSSAFAALDLAQLHQLKSQYLAALQIVDQAETDLKGRLDEVGQARKQLEDLMQQLDAELASSDSPKETSEPTKTTPPQRRSRR
jgi:uncharacterized protein involved in exopolysaccharide biosynthesis